MGRQPGRAPSGASGLREPRAALSIGSKGGGLTLAAAALLLSGCGALRYTQGGAGAGRLASGSIEATSASSDFDELSRVVEARAVADLSGMELGLPRFFVGFGVAQVWPENSTLERDSSTLLYDCNMVYDISSRLALETLVGLWDIPDGPSPESGSTLSMRPVLASLQLNVMDGSKWRVYVAGGGGWVFNDYDLGSGHKAAVMAETGSPVYGVEVDDGPLVLVGGGLELYSSSDAELTVGIELRYVRSQMDRTQRLDTATETEQAEINLWLARVNLSWHF